MSNSTCSVDQCERSIKNKTHQLCDPHYKRFWRTGDVQAHIAILPERARPQEVVDHADGTRECQDCGRKLPLNDFHNDAKGPGGKRKTCKVCRIESEMARYRADPEKVRVRVTQYRANNLDLVRKRDMERYERDYDKRLAGATAQSHVRRARMVGTATDRGLTIIELRKRDGDLCHYCGVPLVFGKFKRGERPDNMGTLEHKVAISRGGTHTWDNCVIACWRCNSSKGCKDVDVWTRAQASVALTA